MKLRSQTRLLLVLLAATAVAGGCLDSGDSNAERVTSVTRVNGTWNGTVSTGEGLAFVLTQEVVAFSGTATVGGQEAAMSGEVDGRNITGTIASEPPRVVRGSVSFDSMSGTFRDLTGGILANFNAVRTEGGDP